MPNRERSVSITSLLPQQVLSRHLFNDAGQLILGEGTVLSPAQIARLREIGLTQIWVQEPGVGAERGVSQETLQTFQSAVACIEQLFQTAKHEMKIDMDSTERALNELLDACVQESNTLNLMVNLKTYDAYTYQHSIGVGLLSSRIGEWLGLSERECRELLVAGVLHDVGKCLIDERVLLKPSRLTADEYEQVKRHTHYGHMLLLNAGMPERIALVALHHHERMDGSGYPLGLVGQEIDLYGRIVAVADVFNAMTSRRVYRDAESYYKVLDEVHQNAFGALDPQIVTVFIGKMTAFLVGNIVELNDGTVGTVVMIPTDRPTRPLLKTDAGFVDLLTRPDLYIEEVKAV